MTAQLQSAPQKPRRERGEGSLVRVKGSRFWYIAYYDAAGKQQKESSGSEVKQVALALLRDRLKQKDEGKIVQLSAQKKLRYEDIRDLLLNRLEENRSRSLVTVAGKRTLWNLKNIDSFFQGMRVRGITDDTISEYRKKRRVEGGNPSTVNRELSLLRRMMYYAKKKKKYAGDIPDFGMTEESASVRRGFLEQTDFERLVSLLPFHLHPLLIFLYTVAVRLGEAQAIQWNQIDLKRRTVQLHDTKSGEWRTVPLASKLIELLLTVEQSKRRGPVFYQGLFRRSWISACIRCGFGRWEYPDSANTKKRKYSGLIVHDFRRSAIRNMTLAGVPQNVIMAISGHRTVSVFLRYNIVAPKQLHTAMQAVELMQTQAIEGENNFNESSMKVEAGREEPKQLNGWIYGAGDRDRTGDIQLGKLAFYR
jgi:integrase